MIRSEINIENEIVGYTIITGRIMMDQKLLALCEMRILLKETGDAHLRQGSVDKMDKEQVSNEKCP